MGPRLRVLLVLLVLVGLALPWIGKPVHIDEANFLALARGAAADPWRPHAVAINWQGRTEPAFDVLSNPPGVGWLLAPLLGAPLWAMRLWMLGWLIVAVPAAARLGAITGASGPVAALLLAGSPIAMWASGALTPDLPLFSLSLAGMAGVLSAPPAALGRAWPWALLLGLSACFRYSGLALVPLVALWPLLHRQPRAALALGAAALAPILALTAHDLVAYGRPHLLAMVGFQGVADTDRDRLRKGVAALAMLGGAGVLPILAWARWRGALLGALLGAALGLGGAALSGQAGVALLGTVLATAAGGATLGGALRARDRLDLLLVAWLALGLLFLLTLRFTATRYWLPFLAPLVLLSLRQAPPGLARAAVGLTLGLGLLLAADDSRLAEAQEAGAAAVLRAAGGERGRVAGHWGFQYHLEFAGWIPLEDDTSPPVGSLLAVSTAAWPQTPAPGTCLRPLGRWELPDAWPLPRVHTAEGAANLHASSISGSPPVESYAPWGFGRDPLDVVLLWRVCR